MTHPKFISNQSDLDSLCQVWQSADMLAVDTEFLMGKTYAAKLCLIQIAGPDKSAAIDPLADLDLSGLYTLFRNQNILKVFHSPDQDLQIFYDEMGGGLPTPIFDTQIAAQVLGYGHQIGYANLVAEITGQKIDKGPQRMNWAKRPLPDTAIDYALSDVVPLRDVYHALLHELDNRGRRDWITLDMDELSDPTRYDNDPGRAWKSIRHNLRSAIQLNRLKFLARWREHTAQHADIPVSWVMKDHVLTKLAKQRPESPDDLANIREISKKSAFGKTGDQILSTLRQADAIPADQYPDPRKSKPRRRDDHDEIVDKLRKLVKQVGADIGVPPPVIATRREIEAFVRNPAADVPLTKGWRWKVFGQQASEIRDNN
jgi:ribonuclease D